MEEANKLEEANKIIADLRIVFLGLVRALVDEPDSVTLETSTVGAETVFHLYVAKRDLGKIIGKQGRTAQSIRVLLAAASMKYTQRFALDIACERRP